MYFLYPVDIRRSNRPFLEDKTEDDFFQIDVRIFLISLYCLLKYLQVSSCLSLRVSFKPNIGEFIYV